MLPLTLPAAGEGPHPLPRLLPVQAGGLQEQGGQALPHPQADRWPVVQTNPPGPYNFVGAAGPMEVKAVCPEECRPPEHLDWTLC